MFSRQFYFSNRTICAGNFSAEVLAPEGRLPVNIRNPDRDTVQVGFTARHEGNH